MEKGNSNQAIQGIQAIQSISEILLLCPQCNQPLEIAEYKDGVEQGQVIIKVTPCKCIKPASVKARSMEAGSMEAGHGEIDSNLMAKDMVGLIEQLGYPLHTDAIQRTKDKQTHKGYDTDGYGYQFCINRFNKVFGDEWGLIWDVLYTREGTTSSGKICFEITVKVGIWVQKKDNVRSLVGGHTSKTHFDALKGAVTNGFKKAAALWGVGRQAYEGSLDDDNDPYPEWVAQNGLESQEDGKQASQEQRNQSNQEQGKQSNPEQGNQSSKGPTNQSSKEQARQSTNQEQAKQSNQDQGKQARQRPGKQPNQGQQAQPPKQEDSALSKSNGNGNGHESSQQNGHTPPASSPTPPAGNGKEAGLRRRIIAMLETIFGRSEEMITTWLDRNFGIKRIEVLSNLHADVLEKILEKVEEKFKDWKSGKNN